MLVLTIGLQMFLHVSAIGRSTRDSSRAKQTLVVDFISFKLNGRDRMCEEQVRTIRLVHTSNRKLLLGIVAFSSCFQLKVDNGHILGRNTKSRFLIPEKIKVEQASHFVKLDEYVYFLFWLVQFQNDPTDQNLLLHWRKRLLKKMVE